MFYRSSIQHFWRLLRAWAGVSLCQETWLRVLLWLASPAGITCLHTPCTLLFHLPFQPSKPHLLNFFSQREFFSPDPHSFLHSPFQGEKKNRLTSAHLKTAPLHQQFIAFLQTCLIVGNLNIRKVVLLHSSVKQLFNLSFTSSSFPQPIPLHKTLRCIPVISDNDPDNPSASCFIRRCCSPCHKVAMQICAFAKCLASHLRVDGMGAPCGNTPAVAMTKA